MFSKEQIIYNSKFIVGEELSFFTNNRAFLYGDSIFETLRINNRDILFFEEHLQRLVDGMRVLKYKIPDIFTKRKKVLYEQIIQLLNRNKIFKSSRIRINVYRKTGGFYTPETNEVDYVISAKNITDDNYVLNVKGLHLGIFEDVKKPINVFSQFKTANSLIYVLAGVHKKEYNFDDCLILNTENFVIEAISANVFLVKNGKLFYPPITDACINGIMRFVIINIAKLNKIECVERSISKKDLLLADEIFLTNSISGIQWVVAYKNKRYFKKMSNFLISELNK